jgi:hypothetical protein
MKSSEILRNLADALDAKMKQAEEDAAKSKEREHHPTLDHQPDDIMIPPLQLKIELLKKATGVENVFAEVEGNEDYVGDDSEDSDDSSEDDDGSADLEAIKKFAGVTAISPVVLDSLVDDEPLES